MDAKDADILKFLEDYKASESLNIFMALREECQINFDPPIVLEHQILIDDGRKSSLQDLEMLIKDGALKKLKIPQIDILTNMTTYGYVLTSDIIRVTHSKLIHIVRDDETCTGIKICLDKDSCAMGKLDIIFIPELINWMKIKIFPIFTGLKISNADMMNCLNKFLATFNIDKGNLQLCKEHIRLLNTDKLLTYLMRSGILRRDEELPNKFLAFSIPTMGGFIQQLESGNKAIITALKRFKYNETTLDKLECINLGKSNFTLDFHLRDLQGRGILKKE
ncbi:uncharacterized protein CMU_016710 [Cryptosporidium muris RN66]|uniref:Uncharacterized protein n=1 Tax=Cryptosporidium muris (strain RN66) TaxID=441375 RepID=B6ACR7_CRYMR|nr:uncharacterized protein CMU_016710 [Cryptosporidium muris RN66]EEA05921.1 hypothetical protein, conserved [Cryptosporidium muris RN66]|eukprot:XP_002140270.1 hypothetical protein [Cryptosporidium muris RN66]